VKARSFPCTGPLPSVSRQHLGVGENLVEVFRNRFAVGQNKSIMYNCRHSSGWHHLFIGVTSITTGRWQDLELHVLHAHHNAQFGGIETFWNGIECDHQTSLCKFASDVQPYAHLVKYAPFSPPFHGMPHRLSGCEGQIVTLVLFALSMSFLFAIGGTALDARGMLARSSSMGCIAATVIGTVVLLTFFQMPAVKNARLLPQQEQVLIQPVEAPVLVPFLSNRLIMRGKSSRIYLIIPLWKRGMRISLWPHKKRYRIKCRTDGRHRRFVKSAPFLQKM